MMEPRRNLPRTFCAIDILRTAAFFATRFSSHNLVKSAVRLTVATTKNVNKKQIVDGLKCLKKGKNLVSPFGFGSVVGLAGFGKGSCEGNCGFFTSDGEEGAVVRPCGVV